MPFQPSAPNTGKVTTEQDQVMGLMKIHELHLFIDPNDQTNVKAEVHWSEGYEQASVYYPLKFHKATIEGQNLIDKINEVPTGQTVYDAVKTRSWELLQMEPADKTEKYIGAGNIT
jgi:hypothetical protein